MSEIHASQQVRVEFPVETHFAAELALALLDHLNPHPAVREELVRPITVRMAAWLEAQRQTFLQLAGGHLPARAAINQRADAARDELNQLALIALGASTQ